MKPGGGKQKGGQFERDVCKQLSLWISDGLSEDLFWRSAMSGGRATVGAKKGKDHSRHAGDIAATSAEGSFFTDIFYMELKFYKNLHIEKFLLNDSGILANFWSVTCRQANKYKRQPLLIAKQNRLGGALVISHPNTLKAMTFNPPIFLRREGKSPAVLAWLNSLTAQPFILHP